MDNPRPVPRALVVKNGLKMCTPASLGKSSSVVLYAESNLVETPVSLRGQFALAWIFFR